MTRFTPAEDEQLIELVAGHRILWDMQEVEFKNTLKKDLIWNEIAGMTNKTGKQCKQRWKHIRDHYRKVKRQDSAGTGSAATKKRATYWNRLRFLDSTLDERDTMTNAQEQAGTYKIQENSLQEEFVQIEEENIEDIPEEIIDSPPVGENLSNKLKRNHDDVASISKSKTPSKRYRKDKQAMEILQSRAGERMEYKKYMEKLCVPECEDDIDLFFKAMAASVKKFDPSMRAEVKLKVCNLITDCEMRSLKSKQPGLNYSEFDDGSRPASSAYSYLSHGPNSDVETLDSYGPWSPSNTSSNTSHVSARRPSLPASTTALSRGTTPSTSTISYTPRAIDVMIPQTTLGSSV